jgi:hypothetical protein
MRANQLRLWFASIAYVGSVEDTREKHSQAR